MATKNTKQQLIKEIVTLLEKKTIEGGLYADYYTSTIENYENDEDKAKVKLYIDSFRKQTVDNQNMLDYFNKLK